MNRVSSDILSPLRTALMRTTRFAAAAALAFSTAFSPLTNSLTATGAQAETRNFISLRAEDANKTRAINLGLDKSIVIDLPADAHDILVANPEVADAVTRTSRRIYIFGKEVGQTNIFVFDGRGKQIASLELTIERDIAGLEDMLRRFIPNSEVKAEMLNGNLVLTGYVSTAQDSATAMRIAEAFVKGRPDDNSGGQAAPGGVVIGGSGNAEDTVFPIINMLKIDGEDQVHLKVVIAEIQRSVVKQLGISPNFLNNLSEAANGTDGIGFSVLGGSAPTLDIFGAQTGQGSFTLADQVGRFSATYNAMEKTGVMRTLAEPSLTAISGEKAHFRVGGIYSIPRRASDTDRGQAIEFTQLEYGVALTFTPVVLTEGRINLKLRTEVSEPTAEAVFTTGSRANLLNLRKRVADTVVELPSGGSMVIAGLVQDDVRQAVNGQPLLKDIPFFGTLFRSREFVRNESEVVIFVTPYLVKPVNRRQLTRPDKNFAPTADGAGYLLGRINRVYGTRQGKLPKGRYTGPVGFIFK